MLKSILAAAILCAGLAAAFPAFAQTIALYVDTPERRVSAFDVQLGTDGVFSIIVVVDTDGRDINAVEWVRTTLTPLGVFRLSGWFPCSTCHNLGDVRLGEYLLPLGRCWEPDSPMVVFRTQYMAINDVIGSDFVMSIRGFEPGDTRPSSFNGSPGFVDCSENKIPLTVQGGPALITGSGVVVPSGNVVLNPTPVVAVGNEGTSFGRIKAVFR